MGKQVLIRAQGTGVWDHSLLLLFPLFSHSSWIQLTAICQTSVYFFIFATAHIITEFYRPHWRFIRDSSFQYLHFLLFRFYPVLALMSSVESVTPRFQIIEIWIKCFFLFHSVQKSCADPPSHLLHEDKYFVAAPYIPALFPKLKTLNPLLTFAFWVFWPTFLKTIILRLELGYSIKFIPSPTLIKLSK